MNVPNEIQAEVDRILIKYNNVFRQAVKLFEDNDISYVFEKLMTEYLLNHEKEMKIKHLIILLAIGKSLIEAGFDKNIVKKCQIEILKKHTKQKSNTKKLLQIILLGILHMAVSETLAFF